MTVPVPWLRFDFAPPSVAVGSGPLVFADPLEVVEARTLAEVVPALRAVQEATESGRWAAGFVAYEAAPAFDPAMTVVPRSAETLTPLVWFGLFAEPADASTEEEPGDPDPLPPWTPSVDRATYDAAIADIRAAIARGDTYQVNHTVRLRGPWPARDRRADLAHYARLRRAQQAAYAAYLDLGPYRVLSVSPELFFARDGTRVTTRPMKGTAPRGRWAEEDADQRDIVLTSAKNRAENVMIVDLLRNDLGRLARPGTLAVPDMLTPERYPTVWQLTSTVTAEVPAETGLSDLFGALFPCGSVTGAPKIETMHQIATHEADARHVYCGAVGVVAPGGAATFNVAIRTVLLDMQSGTGEYGVGGGVTWDSTAGDEYAELLVKATVLHADAPVFDLIETLRLVDGRFWLEERHRERLRGSAAWLGWADPDEAVGLALRAVAGEHPLGPWRVRLVLAPSGAVRTEVYPLEPNPSGPVRVLLATGAVDSREVFLQHKTTHRRPYAAACRQLTGDPEAYDVLLHNERGELTELTRGNLVVAIDGRLWTPPRDSGLLGGVERAEALASGRVSERVLTPADIERADEIWFVNSVRGWLPVVLA